MAFLIPENIASHSDLPSVVQAVARSLRDDLDEEVISAYFGVEDDAED